MIRPLVRRAAALSVLAVLLAASWSSAEPLQRRGATAPPTLEKLWSRLTSLWSDIGCGADPNGLCRGAAPIQGDIGCVIDPNGGCRH